MGHCVNANCRTIFFSSCRNWNWKIAVFQVFFVFDDISVKSRSLQMKLIWKLISNILNILAIKTEEVEKSF